MEPSRFQKNTGVPGQSLTSHCKVKVVCQCGNKSDVGDITIDGRLSPLTPSLVLIKLKAVT